MGNDPQANVNLDDIDQEVFFEFLDESMDGLETVASLLVELESRPDDLGLLNAIFRPVHSMKGNAAFFGLLELKKLAHNLENMLDLLRKQQLQVSAPVTDALLAGVDELRAMLKRVRNSRPQVEDFAALSAILDGIKTATAGTAVESDELWAQLIEKLDRIGRHLGRQDKGLLSDLESVISAIRELAPHPLKPEIPSGIPAAAANIQELLAAEIKTALAQEQSEAVLTELEILLEMPADEPAKAEIQDLIENWHAFMDAGIGFDDLLRETVLDKLVPLIQRNAWSAEPLESTPLEAGTTKEPVNPDQQTAPEHLETGPSATDGSQAVMRTPQPAEAHHKTMRVSEEHIDMFLEFVGELLVVGDMFQHLETSVAVDDVGLKAMRQLRTVNNTFSTLSNNLQKSIMSIRKVSVHSLLQKVPRMVRDIAAKAGKEIAVETDGHEVEVDKSLIDLLDAPLTHMVRNAADHGIEMPDQRVAAGKDPKGFIHVTVEETDVSIVLTVQDDGAGLDFEAIRGKAESLGLIESGAQLTEQAVVDLLFAAGVSTAKEVTDVSGRGVGMDVVKRMIDEGGGAITVSSDQGKGSVFRVQMPKSVTTQIMPGFLVKVDGQAYVLPMEKVREATKIEKQEIKTVVGKGRCVVRHEKLLPFVSLSSILGLNGRGREGHEAFELANAQGESCTMITIVTCKGLQGVVVDDVLGVQQVVLRQIEGVDVACELVTGGALLGDGNVALVLDVDKLMVEA